MDADTTHTQLLSKPVDRGVDISPSTETQRQLTIIGGVLLAIGAATAAFRWYELHKNKISTKVCEATHSKKYNHFSLTHTTTAKKQAVPASAATMTTTGLTSSSKTGSRSVENIPVNHCSM